jgi:hypothetical protein
VHNLETLTDVAKALAEPRARGNAPLAFAN